MIDNLSPQVSEETTVSQGGMSQKNAAKWMRVIGSIEGTSSLLLFFVAMPLKYLGQNPILVQWVGPVHGGLFLLYVASAVAVARILKWRWFHIVMAFGASVIPFGPFIFEAWLRRSLYTETQST
jgi:integral membrane protein